MNVKEILQRTPPRILYHYTTQQGLLGIISNQEIWATHTQYLNDIREFRHATELARQELSSMPVEESSREYVSHMQKALLGEVEAINVCVCSFSAQGDVLSQWRTYGGAASGFAIGFSGEHLREIVAEWGWLVPVLYEEHEQRLLVRTLLKDLIEENRNRSPEERLSTPRSGNLRAYLNRYAPILKHKSFREEDEWRIVTRPLPCVNERFSYRPGPSMLIPYFRFPLGKESLGIQEIVVGPTPHPEQSIRSVEGILTKNFIKVSSSSEVEGVVVSRSEVPYRNW